MRGGNAADVFAVKVEMRKHKPSLIKPDLTYE